METDGYRITHQVDNGRNADRDNCPSKWYSARNPAVKCSQLSASAFHRCAHERRSVWRQDSSQIKPAPRPRERREVLREKCNPSRPADRVGNEKEHRDSRVPLLCMVPREQSCCLGDPLVHLNLRVQCNYFIRERRLRDSLRCPEVNAGSWQRLGFDRQNG